MPLPNRCCSRRASARPGGEGGGRCQRLHADVPNVVLAQVKGGESGEEGTLRKNRHAALAKVVALEVEAREPSELGAGDQPSHEMRRARPDQVGSGELESGSLEGQASQGSSLEEFLGVVQERLGSDSHGLNEPSPELATADAPSERPNPLALVCRQQFPFSKFQRVSPRVVPLGEPVGTDEPRGVIIRVGQEGASPGLIAASRRRGAAGPAETPCGWRSPPARPLRGE